MSEETATVVASSFAHRRPERGSSALRIGALALMALVAVAAAFDRWVVSGLVFPVVVQGGSMAPSLLGEHRHWQCDACGGGFDCLLEALPVDGSQVACPHCKAEHSSAQGELVRGDRLLIDRVSYLRRAPQRWEIVVCDNPHEPSQLCAKRVVGLPGERLRIAAGDVFSNGQIVRKSLAEQQATRVLVGRRLRESLEDDVNWLGVNGPVLDDSPYNPTESRRLNEVTDLGLGGLVQVSGQGTIYLRAAYKTEEFLARLSLESGLSSLAHNGCQVACETVSWRGKEPVRLEWMLADRRLLLAIDGKAIFTYDFEPGAAASGAADRTPILAIGSQGCKLELTDPQVWRDVYYLPAEGDEREYLLGPDEYFVLGDNSAHSLDSRAWLPQERITSRRILGRAVRR